MTLISPENRSDVELKKRKDLAFDGHFTEKVDYCILKSCPQ